MRDPAEERAGNDDQRQLMPRRRRAGVPAVIVAGLLAVNALIRGDVTSGRQTGRSSKPASDPDVTAVAGPSWLNRLGVAYGETTLGRSGALYGPPPGTTAGAVPKPLAVVRPVLLSGADLYRLNCQSCHRAEGTGSPPEIKSVLAAVQGSSLELVRRQLTKQGKADAESLARAQVSKARRDLHDRITKGGQKMPALSHLQEGDFRALYAYLTHLSGSPDPVAGARRTVSWSRLGELVIKGTCHICHDAVGPRPARQELLAGTIPALSVLLEDKPVVDFVTKVRTGAPVMVGDPVFHYRGRMPVLPHLRDEEIAAAYMFLADYPPQAKARPASR
jgi:mono/diheme cytochrome c family protein